MRRRSTGSVNFDTDLSEALLDGAYGMLRQFSVLDPEAQGAHVRAG
jgi:hypothetical protein